MPKFRRDFQADTGDQPSKAMVVREDALYEPINDALWSERLQPEGEPQPTYILRNKSDKGFISPRHQFIQLAQQPTLREVAIDWEISEKTIIGWAQRQNWFRQRERYNAEINKRMWDASGQTLAEMRGEALERSRRNFQEMQDLVMEMARTGTKERILPTGDTARIAFDPMDVYRLVKALEVGVKGEMAAVGLNYKVGLDASQDIPEDENKPATGMVFVVPMTELERRKAELLGIKPGDKMPDDMEVEGELVETQGEEVES